MQMDLNALRRKAWDAAGRSPLESQVQNILLESDTDFVGDEFLRIEIRLKANAKPSFAKLLALRNAIKNEIVQSDERYTSIRFPDAA